MLQLLSEWNLYKGAGQLVEGEKGVVGEKIEKNVINVISIHEKQMR